MFFAVRVTISTGHLLIPWLWVMSNDIAVSVPVYFLDRWIGFHQTTSASRRTARSSTLAGGYVYNNDVVHGHSQYRRQDDQIVDGRQGCTVDPLVDGLRSCEAKHSLQVLYGKAGSDPHPVDILTGRNNVDVRNSYHVAPPVRQHNRHRKSWLRRLIHFHFSG